MIGPDRQPANLVDLLRRRAAETPQLPVYTFLADGEQEADVLTCAELERRVRVIAATLQKRSLAGQRALLLYPPGLEFIAAYYGCLYAGVIAVPAYPPKANRSLPRLMSIVTDAKPAVVMTVGSLLDGIRQRMAEQGGADSLFWLATDTLTEGADTWRAPWVGSDTLAFLQYTSGSTGDPKGVMVSHGNILANSAALQSVFELTHDTVLISWLPSFHDMGLISSVVMPIYTGFRTYVMAPAAFLQKPIRWLQAFTRYRGTFGGGPNSGYELCLRSMMASPQMGLDLSSWRTAFNGAEPVHDETLRRFCEVFASSGFAPRQFFPCYGMAEATLIISGGPAYRDPVRACVQAKSLQQHQFVPARSDDPDTAMLVSSGQAVQDTRIMIVDPERLMPCGPGQIGEIWVNSPSVAHGYWQREEKTRETFQARLAGSNDGPFLRTGDLGYLQDGEVFVTGRLKDLIIIAGSNYYPQDIELTVERCHAALAPGSAAAFSIESGLTEQLVVVVEVLREARKKVQTDEVFATIRKAIAEEHDLPVHAIVLLAPLTVPKTSSGKIQRRAAQQAYLTQTFDVIASWEAPAVTEDSGPVPVPSDNEAGRIEQWLRSYISRRVGIAPEQIRADQPFTSYGLGSMEAVVLSGELERWLGRPVPQTLVYDRPTIAEAVRWLSDTRVPAALPDEKVAVTDEPIAVVGLGCRFPGASDPEGFWTMLRDGVDAVSEVPAGRFAVVASDSRQRWGAFLDQVDQFDADFFGIAPREAVHMDPQQRLLLEVAWETFEHAGCDPRRLAGSRTGVFVGISGSDYLRMMTACPEQIDAYIGTGGAGSIAANRLSYWLDLRGPSIALDTACSSSLVAVHMACASLRDGECRAALAGGVNLILSPDVTRAFADANMLAADGRCKTFAAGADGYVRGEGCGLVLLKRLRDAVADGDRVLALIRGTAVNQDGRSNGLTAPNGPSQQAVIRQSLRQGRISPADVDYVEAHGTGTELGDPIEVQALAAVLSEGRDASRPLWTGSVKTNIGHLESAAGIAGLIKVILAMQHGEIPPHLHFHKPNPYIPWDRLAVRVPTQRVEWPSGTRRRIAGVSSFGFGGTNAHAVVEEPPAAVASEAVPSNDRKLLCVSARDGNALAELAARYAEHLALHPEQSLADVCYTSAAGRTHFDHRAAIVADSREEYIEQLRSLTIREPDSKPARVAFLFTGQGSQYAGMARRLYDTVPLFRRAIDRCDAVFRECVGESLVSLLYDEAAASHLDETRNAQPSLYALEWALSELWQSWGIAPAAVMGHSVGEYVAAAVAGVFSVEDGLRLVAERAKLMHAAPGRGRMAAVFADERRVSAVLTGESTVSIAAYNGPAEIVISGDAAAVDRVIAGLSAEGIRSQVLRTSHAFHSSLMEPVLPAFAQAASRVAYARPTLGVVSNVTGTLIRDDTLCSAAYWTDHIRKPVRFESGIRSLLAADVNVFLEMGPQPILISLAQQSADDGDVLWLASLRRGRDDRDVLLESLSQLYVRGVDLKWSEIYEGQPRRPVSLPTYPFQRQRYWLSDEAGTSPCLDASLAEDAENWVYSLRWEPKALAGSVASADFLPAPRSIAKLAKAWLKRLLSEHDLAANQELVPAVEAESLRYVLRALRQLGADAETRPERLGIHPQHHRLFERMLRMRDEAGANDEAISPPGENEPVQLALVRQCGEQLARVLRNECDPLPLLFTPESAISAERLYRDAPAAKVLNSLLADAVAEALQHTPVGRPLRILEIGAGTGGTTSFVLPLLQADRVCYTFTDVSPLFISSAKQTFGGYSFVDYAVLDIAADPATQGFALQDYDLVIAANVIHATPDLRNTLSHVHSLMAPNGLLLLMEGTARQRWLDVTFGLLDGWWAYTDSELRPDYPLLSQEQWMLLLDESGFAGATALPQQTENDHRFGHQSVIVARKEQGSEVRGQGSGEDGTLASCFAVPASQDGYAPGSDRGTWLVLADQGGVGHKLALHLRKAGAQCIEAYATGKGKALLKGARRIDPFDASDYERVLRELAEANSSTSRIVYLWGLDAAAESSESLLAEQSQVLSGVVRLVQSIRSLTWKQTPELWMLTRGAQAIGGDRAVVCPSQASLWALGQVIGLEWPEGWRGLIDLDPAGEKDEIDALLNEILHNESENLIARRGGLRLAARLVPARALAGPPDVASPPDLAKFAVAKFAVANASGSVKAIEFRVSPDGCYVVTGGLGGVGLQVARWLAESGARHLVLLGRKSLPLREAWPSLTASDPLYERVAAVQELERLGVRVDAASVDVGDANQLAAILDRIRGCGEMVRGVIHAAGVPDHKLIAELDNEGLASVLRPKAVGAWNLHELTRNDPLDFFVCFSSASSILGAEGQAYYAAANALLDGLIQYRRRHGLCGLSVNWGRWGVGGMLSASEHEQFARIGLRPMKPAAALNVLGQLIASNESQALVSAFDWSRFKAMYQARSRRHLLDRIDVQEATETKQAAEVTPTGGFLAQLMQAAPAKRKELFTRHVTESVAAVLGMGASRSIDPEAGFFAMGMDSLMAVSLRTRLQTSLGRELPRTLAFEHPTVASLSDYLFAEYAATVAETSDRPIHETRTPVCVANEPIAVVGIGCRLPGGVDDPESFWNLLHDGVDAVQTVPAERWNIDEYYDPNPDAPGRMYTRFGGFVDNVDQFDPQFFGIAPREAVVMDPQHRLLLETAWEALERSGRSPASLKGSRTGVFVGVTSADYSELLQRNNAVDAYYITGNSLNAAGGRLSYLLGLQGPSMAVDAACASSLVAVHLACQSLRSGECDLAMAGGVNLVLSPRGTIAACRAKMLAPDGRCKTFDASADGFIRGEGCGVLVLRRLSEAQAGRDPILAVIRGTAVGQDGASGGLTVPNASAQQDVIRRALADAHVSACEVGYIEAHGTGTSLGDPIEVRALSAVFREQRRKDQPLRLGSVKTNIGHLESASGVAGLIKVILSLQHSEIPPHLHLRQVNPDIPLAEIPAEILTCAMPWARGSSRRVAGVSSFGASGTLAHVVVEEPPADQAVVSAASKVADSYLFCVSARDERALGELIHRYQDYLATCPDASFADVCFTANTGRTHFEHRLVVVCDGREDCIRKLAAAAETKSGVGIYRGVVDRGQMPKDAVAFSSGSAEDLHRIAKAYVQGMPIDWESGCRDGAHRKVVLPTYPFQRQRCWVESRPDAEMPQAAEQKETAGCPLLGHKLRLPGTNTVHYESRLSAVTPAYLADHRVRGNVVFPATGYLSMAMSAAADTGEICVLRNVSIRQAMSLNGSGARCVQLVMNGQDSDRRTFHVYSAGADQSASNGDGWMLHAQGELHALNGDAPIASSPLEEVRRRCAHGLHAEAYYRQLDHRGFEFGPSFRGIAELWRGERESLGRIRLPGDLNSGGNGYLLHPALLDACSQVVGASLVSASSQELYLMVGVDELRWYEPAGEEIWCHANLASYSLEQTLAKADLALFDPRGRRIANVLGLTYRRTDQHAIESMLGQRANVQAAQTNGKLLRQLQQAAPADRERILLSHVQRILTTILGLTQSPDPRVGFFDLGMDSLMAVELKDGIERLLGHRVPATVLFEQSNLKSLTQYLLTEVLAFAETAVPAAEMKPASNPDVAMADLSTDEVAAIFARKLAELKKGSAD